MKLNLTKQITEKEIKNKIKTYLELQGWKVWTLYNAGIYSAKDKGYYFHSRKGLADLLAYKDKKLLFLEIKRPEGKITQEQDKFLQWINSVEIIKGKVCKNLEDIKKIEEEIDTSQIPF